MLVISCCNKLQVFALPEDMARGGLRGPERELVHVRTLGGVAPIKFQFFHGSGYMAFTDGIGTTSETISRRLLLVTDAGQAAVHVIDVVSGSHVGYVIAPGTYARPRGVATRKSLAAISTWEEDPAVRVFEASSGSDDDCTWTAVRLITGYFDWPHGLRFTGDGLRLAVAGCYRERVSIFSAKDGSFLHHRAYAANPLDVEECDSGGAGWVMCDARSRGLVAIADTDTDTPARTWTFDFGVRSLALVPGVGLVVRLDTGVQFLATPDAIAMASMSLHKVAWMVAAWRGRKFLSGNVI